jgi:hypothetical protein
MKTTLLGALATIASVGHAARADRVLQPLVGVASVTVSSEVKDGDNPSWKIASGGEWCVLTPSRGVGESVAIAFDPPAKLDGVAMSNVGGQTNVVSAIEVTVDGRAQRIVAKTEGVGASTLVAKLDGKPIGKLVVKIAAIDKGAAEATCMRAIELQATPQPSTVYGVIAADVAALEPRVIAIRDALRSCKGLGDALVFPFEHHELTMDQNGMKELVHPYKTAAAATTACKKKKLAPIVEALTENASVDPKGPGEVAIASRWRVKLVDKTWKLVRVDPM